MDEEIKVEVTVPAETVTETPAEIQQSAVSETVEIVEAVADVLKVDETKSMMETVSATVIGLTMKMDELNSKLDSVIQMQAVQVVAEIEEQAEEEDEQETLEEIADEQEVIQETIEEQQEEIAAQLPEAASFEKARKSRRWI